MKTKYHIEITRKALADYFSEHALRDVVQGNIRQDRIRNQFDHDHIHFDGSAFGSGFDYLERQKQSVIDSINIEAYNSARQSLGRVTHSWQDFYSHSNYVRLWLADHAELAPAEIEINKPEIISHPDLKSGKNYGLLDFLAMIPGISRLIKPHMPDDSHAAMNLDSFEAGELFHFVYQAALKQTHSVFKDLKFEMERRRIPQEKIATFLGK